MTTIEWIARAIDCLTLIGLGLGVGYAWGEFVASRQWRRRMNAELDRILKRDIEFFAAAREALRQRYVRHKDGSRN